MTRVVREMRAMIAGMQPELIEGDVIFCTTDDPAVAARCLPDAIGMFREREGQSFIMPVHRAIELGFDVAMPMRAITLNVYSALDGIGLTAAVASALADHDVPCNMVAAYHHDHAFVPAARAKDALLILQDLARADPG